MGFTSWSFIWKGLEICDCSLWKNLKGLTGAFYGYEKDDNFLMIYLTVHLQQLKGMQRIKLACERGSICLWKVHERGPLSVKNSIYKGKRLDFGAEPPQVKFCWVTLPWVEKQACHLHPVVIISTGRCWLVQYAHLSLKGKYELKIVFIIYSSCKTCIKAGVF